MPACEILHLNTAEYSDYITTGPKIITDRTKESHAKENLSSDIKTGTFTRTGYGRKARWAVPTLQHMP